jgi:outer membrane protein assembly factor BamB
MTSLGSWVVSARARTALGARRSFSVLAVAALAAAGLTAIGAAGPAGAAAAHAGRHDHAAPVAPGAGPTNDETTGAQNNLRDGWDPNEPALTQAAVAGGQFGQVFKTSVNGQVYAQPLVIGNTLIVATEANWVYGLNATTGAVLWSTFLGTPYTITSCKDLVPDIGITSTPVYDPNTGSVYVMSLVKKTTYQFRLFGLNVGSGAVTLNSKVEGHPSNDSHITFSPIPQDQRTALLLLNGWVYAAFASHCDHKPYAGYVSGVDVESTSAQKTLWTDEAGVSDNQAGIWQSDGGMMSDGSNRIFFTSGNGISPAKGPGDKPPGQLAESVVRLELKSNDDLQAKDFFSPANAPKLDAGDKDFGAGGPAGLPFGTKTYPDIVAQAGKYGRLYLLNRNDLGGRQQNKVGGDEDLFEIGHLAGLWGHPGIFADTTTLTTGNAASSNDYLYYLGSNDYLRAFKAGVNSSDEPTLTDEANSTFLFGYGSGSPVVTSNGTNANSGIVWVVDSPDPKGDGKDAWLGAFDATPQPKAGGGTKLHEIWSSDIGTAVKFTTAATANGMVYVGTRDGNVYGFGITSGSALKSGGTDTFADTTVGSATSSAASVTATRTVTVTGAALRSMTQPDPFTISGVTVTRAGGGTATAKFPVTLHKGDVLRAEVKFAPGKPYGASGAVSFTAKGGPAATVSVPLIGDGLSAGLFSTSASLHFELNTNDGVVTNVPLGINDWETTSIVNGSDTPIRVTGVKAPTGPYTIAGLPAVGTVIKPGEAIPVQGEYSPTKIGAAGSSFTITTNKGPSVRVPLTGAGLKPVIRFASVPARVNFGSVQVGHTAKIWVDIINKGNQTELMSGASTQGVPFRALYNITRGLPVNSTDDLTVPIVFTPQKAGPFQGLYKVTWRDVWGDHSLEVPISGTGVG